MSTSTETPFITRYMFKMYEQYLENIRINYSLSQIEIKIIGFLYNNPGKDTAADIVELRMLPKGNVSQGVDSLVTRGLVKRTPDQTDRRKIHLSLEETSIPIVKEIRNANREFQKELFFGFTEEEKKLYEQLNKKIMDNLRKGTRT